MEQPTYADISQYSFDELIDFLFAREVPSETEKRDPWYWHTEVVFDPQLICSYYVRLFRQPSFLLDRFSKAQLEQAFWAIPGQNLECSAGILIWNTDLPFGDREECVRSMSDLFANLFATEPLETSVSMWWDALCYDWHCGNRNRQRGGEDLLMQDVMFETLRSILEQDSAICQGAALHGLGHLHHPDTPQLIEGYLKQNPSLSKERKEYAHAAARFQVL
jgi:hypothetical protein